MSRVPKLITLTAAAALAGGACGGEKEIPSLPDTKWVEIQDGSTCSIDMRHVLDDLVIVDAVGRTGGAGCEVGDRISPGQLPEGADRALAQKRKRWTDLLDTVKDLATDGENHPFLPIGQPDWVTTVGQDTPDGLELNDGGDDRAFGPTECIDGLRGGAGTIFVEALGPVQFEGEDLVLARTITGQDTGTLCAVGELVLLPTPALPNPSRGVYEEEAPAIPIPV